MKWVYHIGKMGDNLKEGSYIGVSLVYLRPVWVEDGKEYTSGVIELRITSMNYMDQLITNEKFSEEEVKFLNPIREKVEESGYQIDENTLKKDEQKHYLNKADIFVAENFNLQMLLKWVELYLTIQGYPFSELEETDYGKFANEVNPLLRIFSIDNVKKFEPEFGPEWWKSTHKKKPDPKTIESLIKQINRN